MSGSKSDGEGPAADSTLRSAYWRGPRLRETVVELEVAFHDVDQMGIVWHGHYLRYFEIARSKLLRGCDLDVGSSLAGQVAYMVAESKCRHGHALRYGDRFRVTAWLSDVKNRLKVEYEIHTLAGGRRCARGHTILACVDGQGNMLLKTPQPVLDRLLGPAGSADDGPV